MAIWLAPFTGTGTDDDPYRPAGAAGRWAVLDLRNDCTQPDGYCVLWCDTDPPADPSRVRLGDSLDSPLPPTARAAVAARLKVAVTDSTVRGLLRSLLTEHATPPSDKTRWNPLQPHRGKFRLRLGDHIDEWSAA